MAKYTLTFAEYLTDHQPPEELEIEEGATDLFVAHFCDDEIGFETETLFGIKLAGMAARKAPLYKDRLSRLRTAQYGVDGAEKVETVIFEEGKKTAKSWELPVDDATVQNTSPSNVGTHESDNDITTRRTNGVTVDEAEQKVRFYERKVFDLYEDFFKEFDNLFMKVY